MYLPNYTQLEEIILKKPNLSPVLAFDFHKTDTCHQTPMDRDSIERASSSLSYDKFAYSTKSPENKHARTYGQRVYI